MESTTNQQRAMEPPISQQTLEIPNHTSDDDDQIVGEDRISNLPESVIGHILSKLPIKEAIATAVLSTRWRYLFSSIPNPIIEFSDCDTASFMNSVPHLFNNILAQFSVIQEFSLSLLYEYGNPRIIEEWLSTAPACNLHCLALFCYKRSSGISSLDALRPMASSLRRLLLCFYDQWYLAAPQSSTMLFPNLTSLCISGAHFVGVNSLERALAACPKLRKLTLGCCRFSIEQDVVCISVPSLRSLAITGCFRHNLELLVDTPDLELFDYNNYIAPRYPVLASAGYRSLSEAIFEVNPNPMQRNSEGRLVYIQKVGNLLGACYNVKILSFNVTHLEAAFPVPTFRNLMTLNFGVLDVAGWEILPKFLHNSSILQVLLFSKVFSNHVECYARFESILSGSVPSCVSSHLSEIVFEEFEGEKEEVKLVLYFLRTARVLEKMNISFVCNSLSHEEVMEIQRDILTSPVCSTNCQIDIVMPNEDE